MLKTKNVTGFFLVMLVRQKKIEKKGYVKQNEKKKKLW